MYINGKAIAADILADLRSTITSEARTLRLTVFTCAPNFETQKFLALKQKRAEEVGIAVTVVTFSPTETETVMRAAIAAAHISSEGIVVQLPFPPGINIEPLLATIAASHDVDALGYRGGETTILPPVVGAIDAIAARHEVTFAGATVVVVGNGRLVGAPAALYAESRGAHVTVVTKDTPDRAATIAAADILILGAGVPGLVSASDIKPGVVIFDAGTSEEGGMLVGDAAADVATVAALVTPVPGGIGPITIAILLRNVLLLQSRK